MSERRPDLIAVSILLIVPTLLFLDVLAGTNVLYLRDVTNYYHPAKTILREIVLNGEFPYWNPYFSAGQPMAANPEHEVFYPLTWLILLPDFNFGFHLLAVLHLHIASLAMYALLRSMNLGRPASVFGGLSFGLGGVVISMLNLWPCLFSLAWLPLTALSTRAYLRSGSRRALAAAACFLGLQLLVGEPVTAFLSGVILGMYAIARGWQEGGARRAVRLVAAVGLISILALLVSAAQTLPAADHLGDSVRSRGLSWDVVRIWSMPLVRVGELFFPRLLGFPRPDTNLPYWGEHLYDERGIPFVFSIYGGLALAVLATAGIAARIRGYRLFLAICFVSLLLAWGANTPLLRFLYDLGVARSWRYAEKFTMMLGFAIPVFASVVLDRLLRSDARLRSIVIRVALAVTGVAAVATLTSFLPIHRAVFQTLWQVPYVPGDALLALSGKLWAIEAARGLLLVMILRNVDRMRRSAWLALLGAFMVLDLGPLTLDTAPRLDVSYYDPPAIVSRFPADTSGTRLLPYDQLQGLGQKTTPYFKRGDDLFWIIRNSLAPMIPADFRIRTVFETDFDLTALHPTADFRRSMLALSGRNPDWINIAAAMSNAGYLLLQEKPELAYERAGGNLRTLQPTKVLKGKDYARYYFASSVVPIRSQQEFVELLATNRYPRDVAFVGRPSWQVGRGSVLASRETANSATIEVEAEGKAFLVMSVTPHKYWRVAIDGNPADPVVTNIGYQGIVVPPGRHTVTMLYRNPLIAAGAAISMATLLFLALIARRSGPATMRPL